MPVMGGSESVEKIRAQERKMGWTRASIIALTANVRDVPDSNEFDESLSKPLSRDRLRRMLQKIYISRCLPDSVSAS